MESEIGEVTAGKDVRFNLAEPEVTTAVNTTEHTENDVASPQEWPSLGASTKESRPIIWGAVSKAAKTVVHVPLNSSASSPVDTPVNGFTKPNNSDMHHLALPINTEIDIVFEEEEEEEDCSSSSRSGGSDSDAVEDSSSGNAPARRPQCKILVVDSAAFIKNSPLDQLGEKIVTIREVVTEIRDKAARARLAGVIPYEIEYRIPSSEAVKAGSLPTLPLTYLHSYVIPPSLNF